MSFSVHTFETNPEGNLGFAFHQNIGEGQDLYFLAKFNPETPDAQSVAESIFGAAVDHFESHPGGNPYDTFEEALKAANQAGNKAQALKHGRPEIIISFFDFHQLYLSQCGKSEAYLVRGTNVSQISELPEDTPELFLNILSGQVSVDDVILFSSDRILRTLTANQLSDIFARPNFSEAVSVFRHEVSAKSEDDILVTTIGIGKKDSISAAGFLSKVIPGKNNAANTKEEPTIVDEVIETPPAIEENQTVSDVDALMDEDEIMVDEPTPSHTEKAFNIGKFNMPAIPALKGFKMPKINKNMALIAGLILALLIVIIVVKSLNFESEEEARLRESLSIARENLQQADTFLIQGEREEAKQYLVRAQESVAEIMSSKSKLFRSDANFLLADINAKQLQVENAREVTPTLIADLGVKNDNLESIGLLELRGNLYAHDTKQVYKTVRNVVEKGLPIGDQDTVLAGSVRRDQNMMLFLTDGPRIVEYKEGLLTPMRTEDENWKRGIDIKTYGRYAYVLDPVENQIWKYERRRANYSASSPYNQGADLSRAVSFTIDGGIYVLADDGSIQKIFRGEKADYSFAEVPSTPFQGKNLKIYTSTELDLLYVLDPDNERVLVFVKGDRVATYKKQILYNLADARDFYIDDSGQKVNIITSDKIYEFSL